MRDKAAGSWEVEKIEVERKIHLEREAVKGELRYRRRRNSVQS